VTSTYSSAPNSRRTPLIKEFNLLRLFAGRENIDKERFIYDRVKAAPGETLILVPNQYTLVAEEQALRWLGTDCLFDVEVLSMNRLGLRVLQAEGTESVPMLDKYGRFMLLTRIIKQHRSELEIYRKPAAKTSFAAMLNDFISEFKQQDCTMEQLNEMLGSDDADELLRAKLKELGGIIESYEQAIEGRYTDSEDYIAMYVEAMRGSAVVAGKNIWIYGYDSITPKFANAMYELAQGAASVNFIVNRNDFGLDGQLISMLGKGCAERGIEMTLEEIPADYAAEKSETVRRIESGLWNDELTEQEIADNAGFIPEDLTVVQAANPYYEAESAAAYVLHLVRDLEYEMRDIQIIANDEGVMQPIVARTFEEYGLPMFLDSSRNITDTAPVACIVNGLWFLVHKKAPRLMFSMLKTGLAADISYEDTEELENYVRNYHIKGSMWDRPFKYGEAALGEEKFAHLNELREKAMEPVKALEKITKAATVGEFVRDYRKYLQETLGLGDKVEKAAEEQEALGYGAEAQRSVQSYQAALSLLDQISEIMGDEPMDLAEFTEVYLTGLGNIEVGVIPPAADGLSVGTMIRTRPRPVKAVVILGANEGTLPLQPEPEGLFSVDEKGWFRDMGFALGSLDDIKMNEENAAMYRIMSKSSEKLYVSWSMTDADGGEATPSTVIDLLTELFPEINEKHLIKKDIISAGWGAGSLGITDTGTGDFVGTGKETLRHLINRIRDRNTPAVSDDLTAALLRWYEDNGQDNFDTMLSLARDENDPKPLGQEKAKKLYTRDDGSLVLSASALQNYFECPFRYYVDRGLRPTEEREFSSDPRSIGDVYHECLTRIAGRIIADRGYGIKLSGCSDDELEKIVSEELEKISESYGGGLFVSTEGETYRMDRIREICAGAVRALAKQLSSGSVSDAKFEEAFGKGGEFSPVEFNVDGTPVRIEGRIDRADILSVGDGNRVRIIDYKTGNDRLDKWKMQNGYKMQLMIYLMSAAGDKYEPAGMFYFNIKDPIEGANNKTADNMEKIEEADPADYYKLRGLYVDEPGVLDAMPEEVLAPTRSKKDGSIPREEFDFLRGEVESRIKEIASDITAGEIGIHPLINSSRLVCEYCSYGAICRRDRNFVRNMGREIPPEEKN